MLRRLRPEKPVAGVTNASAKPWLIFSASAWAARAPPVPMSVGLVAFWENAPGRPDVPTACCSAATPESTITVFLPVPTDTWFPVVCHVYAYPLASPTWKISDPTPPVVKYWLIRCAA